MTTWRMRIACWIPKACVILTAFPLQQWMHESTSVLRHTYIDVSVHCRYNTIVCKNYACVCRKPISPVSFSVLLYRTRYVTVLMCLNTAVVFVLCWCVLQCHLNMAWQLQGTEKRKRHEADWANQVPRQLQSPLEIPHRIFLSPVYMTSCILLSHSVRNMQQSPSTLLNQMSSGDTASQSPRAIGYQIAQEFH